MARSSQRKVAMTENPRLNVYGLGQAKMMKRNTSENASEHCRSCQTPMTILSSRNFARCRFGELAVDRLVRDTPQTALGFRDVLLNVHFDAAKARESSKATKGQLKNAKSALSQLTHAVENLEKVSTDGQDGLHMLLEGPPLDDKKGSAN